MPRLTIHNPGWNRVTVEVRCSMGTPAPSNCFEKPPYGTRVLYKGDSYVIEVPAGSSVCYRREVNPDSPNGLWTIWTEQFLGTSLEDWNVNIN